MMFGEIVDGEEVLELLEKTKVMPDGKPAVPVMVVDCGILS